MEKIGSYGERSFFYWKSPELNEQLTKALREEGENFMVMVVVNNPAAKIVKSIAERVVNAHPLFIHCCGKNASAMEDGIHEAIGMMALNYENETGEEFDYEATPQTAYDQTPEEGLVFSGFGAFHETKEIQKVICLDFTLDEKVDERLKEKLKTMNTGKI